MPGTDVKADLVAEQQSLDSIVAGLGPSDWARPTPSPGWTVADQIGHLHYFDDKAVLALTDTEAFVAHRAELLAKFADPAAVDEYTLTPYRAMSSGELLTTWRAGRAALAEAAAPLADDARVEWYGPSMSLRSFLTARLMECWAHGQDVVDAVGADRPATDRLRHVAQLGVITRGWSYRNRGLPVPEGDVRVELEAPSGASWEWGPPDAADRVEGPAEDFCLVVVQRRHLDDTRLRVTGELARDWMTKAQAFAGPPTDAPSRKG